jgi:hypothetical protein
MKMKRFLGLTLAVLSIVLILSACGGGGDSIEGSWIPKDDSETVGFSEITFKGNNVTFAGVPSTPGAGYVYKIDGSKLIISVKVTGAPEMEFMSFSYKKDGNSIFLNDMEFKNGRDCKAVAPVLPQRGFYAVSIL